MAAKMQDAAGVLVRNNERVHYQPDANPGDRWMVTRDGEPRLWAESLYVIAQHLNLDIEEFNRCAALMEPAAPRETALAAPAAQDTAEVLALLDGADGSGCGPDDTFTLYLPLHRARRLHALVTARIAHDEEARSAASLPRGGADV